MDKCQTCPMKDNPLECYARAINNDRLCELASTDAGYRSIVEKKSLDPDAVVRVTPNQARVVAGEKEKCGFCGGGGKR